MHLPPLVGVIIYITFAPVIFVIEEVIILKDSFLVTVKINEIMQKWAETDGSEEAIKFGDLAELEQAYLEDYYCTISLNRRRFLEDGDFCAG